MITITFEHTQDFRDREDVEYHSVHGVYPVAKSCRKWLADNPKMMRIRDIGMPITLDQLEFGRWQAHVEYEGNSYAHVNDSYAKAVMGLLLTEVPV